MSDFKGITRDTLFLMQLNRFNDSKAFYEENKEKIKADMTVPMRQIAAAFGDMMLKIDPFMNTVPTKMVSRVRRDTRYTHDKHLYRENMWIMFMRPKKSGVCIRVCGSRSRRARGRAESARSRPRRTTWRFSGSICEMTRRASKRPRDRRSAREQCSMPSATSARNPAALRLEDFYNAKYFYFIFSSDELSAIESDEIITRLEGIYKKFAPMYKFLRDVSDDYFKTHQ